MKASGSAVNFYVVIIIGLLETRKRSWYGDEAGGFTVRFSYSSKRKRTFSLPKYADRLWGPPVLLLNGHRGSFLWVKRSGRELISHRHQLPKLRMSGAIPLHAFTALTGTINFYLHNRPVNTWKTQA